MSGVKIGKAKTVNIGSGGGGDRRVGISVSAGGVAILVIVVLAVTHQHTTVMVGWGIVWGLAMVGAAVVAYGVWRVRNRVVQPARQPVCACQAHPVPDGRLPVELPAAARPPAIEPRVANYFFGDSVSSAAVEALGARRDPQE